MSIELIIAENNHSNKNISYLNKTINNLMFLKNTGLLKKQSYDNETNDQEEDSGVVHTDYEMGNYMFEKININDIVSSCVNSKNNTNNLIFFQNNSNLIYKFDFDLNKWKELNLSHDILFGIGIRAIELNDFSYFITGGEIEKNIVDIAFHFISDKIISKPHMIHSRKNHSSIYLEGYVYVFGGIGSDNIPICESERFNIKKGYWSSICEMNYNRAYATPLVYGTNYIFLIGGLSNLAIDYVIYI